MKLDKNQRLKIFKAAIIAMRDAITVTNEYSSERAMKMFDGLAVLELADNQCSVDYENIIIRRERLFNSGFITRIDAFFNSEEELIFQLSTISEDDKNHVALICDFKGNTLGLDSEEISPNFLNLYDLFVLD